MRDSSPTLPVASSTRLSLVAALHHGHFTSSAIVEFSSIRIGWPGTSPVSQALPWALAWSTILCCPSHTGCPSLDGRDGRHLHRKHRDEATDNMSQFRRHHMQPRRILLQRPAGLLFTVDDPVRRSHHPRACAPSCQQRYEVTIDGPMQFAFADPLRLPTPAVESLLLGASGLFAGFPPCGRPRVRHSGEERFGFGLVPSPAVVPSAS